MIYADNFYYSLEGIEAYLEENYPKLMETTFLEIEKAVNLISKNPFIGRNGVINDTRELVLTKLPYYLVYKIKNDELNILNIIHNSRKYP